MFTRREERLLLNAPAHAVGDEDNQDEDQQTPPTAGFDWKRWRTGLRLSQVAYGLAILAFLFLVFAIFDAIHQASGL